MTGGAGFIGSHLVGKLLGLGANVRVADNFYRGRIENIGEYLSRIELLPADLTTLDNCVKATEDVEIVFHLAATVGGIHYINKQNVGGM
ncbi:NAD-dependent epimerase/dehydratase family protein, partial [candidate division WOR-3 bacterium]|nr:NAD-dependent epimerase/dehydratase family protein [candidate division WOR-3 bacterium]